MAVISYNNQNLHLKVHSDIVNFISDNKLLFEPLMIDPIGRETIDLHIQKMKNPMVWATQVELQAAVELYGVHFTCSPKHQTKNHTGGCVSLRGQKVLSVWHTHTLNLLIQEASTLTA